MDMVLVYVRVSSVSLVLDAYCVPRYAIGIFQRFLVGWFGNRFAVYLMVGCWLGERACLVGGCIIMVELVRMGAGVGV